MVKSTCEFVRSNMNELSAVSTPSLFMYMQGYHQSKTKNEDNWGKFDFPIQNETILGEIVFVPLKSGRMFAYLSPETIYFSNVLFLETTSCILNSFLQSSRKTFFRLLIS